MYGRLGSFFLAQYLAESDARNNDRHRSGRRPTDRDAGVLLTWFALAGVACAVLVILVSLY